MFPNPFSIASQDIYIELFPRMKNSIRISNAVCRHGFGGEISNNHTGVVFFVRRNVGWKRKNEKGELENILKTSREEGKR